MGKKVKWTLNPRGKFWSDDDQKFGQKLMEKMGWSKGKGLGAREDGNPDIIKVSYKNDNKGLGFKGCDDAWIEHQDEFNALLTSLNEEETKEDFKTENSLEERSKKSKKRVHYHKFTRGKDLSRCSSDDLSCILGKRKSTASAEEDESKVKIEDKEEVSGDKSFGVITVTNGSSIQDYFAKMMAAKAQKTASLSIFEKNSSQENKEAKDVNCSVNIQESSNSSLESNSKKMEEEDRTCNENVELNLDLQRNVYEDEDNATSKIKKKKKKKKKFCHENDEFTEPQLSEMTADTNRTIDNDKIQRKKKRRQQ